MDIMEVLLSIKAVCIENPKYFVQSFEGGYLE